MQSQLISITAPQVVAHLRLSTGLPVRFVFFSAIGTARLSSSCTSVRGMCEAHLWEGMCEVNVCDTYDNINTQQQLSVLHA